MDGLTKEDAYIEKAKRSTQTSAMELKASAPAAYIKTQDLTASRIENSQPSDVTPKRRVVQSVSQSGTRTKVIITIRDSEMLVTKSHSSTEKSNAEVKLRSDPSQAEAALHQRQRCTLPEYPEVQASHVKTASNDYSSKHPTVNRDTNLQDAKETQNRSPKPPMQGTNNTFKFAPVLRGRPPARAAAGGDSSPKRFPEAKTSSQARPEAKRSVTFGRPVPRTLSALVMPRHSRVLLCRGSGEAGSAEEPATEQMTVIQVCDEEDRIVPIVFASDDKDIATFVETEQHDTGAGNRYEEMEKYEAKMVTEGEAAASEPSKSDFETILCEEEAADAVALLVNHLGQGDMLYEVEDTESELLQLVEKTEDGEQPMEIVREVSAVGIRAVCVTCRCAISHHTVGLLVRRDGTEYGYRCRICQTVYTDAGEMTAHMDSHRPDRQTHCLFCLRGLRAFQPRSEWPGHRCFGCHAAFGTKSQMQRHRQNHPASQWFACEICDKAFGQKAQLEVHMRSHLGIKPYSCDFCPASFVQPSHLINHRRTHTGERPFQCDQCPRAFTQQIHLTVHMRTHTGERPYVCELCDRRFTQSGQLAAHAKLHQTLGEAFKGRRQRNLPVTEDDLVCRVCEKQFPGPRDLRRHMLIHGEKTMRCEVCQRGFRRSDHLKRHMLLHKRPHDLVPRWRRRSPDPSTLTQLDQTIEDVVRGGGGELDESDDMWEDEGVFPAGHVERTRKGPRKSTFSSSEDPVAWPLLSDDYLGPASGDDDDFSFEIGSDEIRLNRLSESVGVSRRDGKSKASSASRRLLRKGDDPSSRPVTAQKSTNESSKRSYDSDHARTMVLFARNDHAGGRRAVSPSENAATSRGVEYKQRQ